MGRSSAPTYLGPAPLRTDKEAAAFDLKKRFGLVEADAALVLAAIGA